MSDALRELTSGQWQRLEDLLALALELPPDKRGPFLDRECDQDHALRVQLDSLLAAHEGSGPLDQPLVHLTGSVPALVGAAPAVGTVVSHYELQEKLGSGGMGVVYRARDLRLHRAVALKFLPAALEDAQAKRRFLAEARAAASLEHSNVCTVHEIGETEDGQLFIAMAFVDGHSLRQLIERGPIPVAQAIEIARQVAAGLEAAHSHGIVHRDIKPANIMVGADGVAKLVDFGVAKLAGQTLTNIGATPGTAAYMSPEQALGEEVDQRTDLWALGVVLYEMLAGERPFAGDTQAAVLNNIKNAEPTPLLRLRPDTPQELERIVTRALQKERAQRFQSAGELRSALRAHSGDTAPSQTVVASPHRAHRFTRSATIAALLVLLALGSIGAYLWLGPGGAARETLRLSISAPGVVTPQLSAEISPDGRKVAFVSTDASSGSMLWVRALAELEARVVPGTERAAHPFWSPDGKSLGFLADNKLKRVDLASGQVQTLVDSVVRWGATWGPNDTILFSLRTDLLAAVPATGGAVRPVLSADTATRQGAIFWPRFLPDGRHFLFYGASLRPERRGIYVGSLDSHETRFLLRSDFRGVYAPPGYLVFAREEALLAQRFDPSRLQLTGAPVVIANGVWFVRPAGHAAFSVSQNGSLAYMNATLWDGELSWFDRTGRPLGTVTPPTRNEGLTPQISPDGQRIAVGRGELGREHVWIVGAAGGGAKRLSVGAEDNARMPVWSGNGRRVMFDAGSRLIIKDVESGAEEVVLDSVSQVLLQDWSRDGRFVIMQSGRSRVHQWIVELTGDRRPRPYMESAFNETQTQLSPDARWIAYTSNETGHDEVYVQTFPVPGQKRQISSNGGAMPRWRADGKEIFFLAANQYINAVPVLDQRTLELGQPQPLFRTRLLVEGSESTGLPTTYAVAPDGQRFLLRSRPVDPGPPMTVVINWLSALKQ